MALEYIKAGILSPAFPDFKVDNFYANRPGQFTFFLSHNHEGKLTTRLWRLKIILED